MEHPFACFTYCPKCGSPRFGIHDEKSKCCADCGFVYYFNPSAATVALIPDAEGRLLVCRRAKEPAKGTLDLPGGFADCHETAEQGVAREVLEETGLHVTSATYLFSRPNIYMYSGFAVHTLDLFFKCEVDNWEDMRAADDASELCLIPVKDLHPADFGLESIRKGLEIFLKEYE